MNQAFNEEYVIEPAGKLVNWREIWQYRELFYFFTWRDIKVKYKQTFFGIAWALIQPLFLVLIFTLFFGKALQIPSGSLPYPVFAFSGLLIWTLFSSGLNNAGSSMVSNAAIIKKVYFPRLVIPVSAIITAAFDFVFGFVVFIVLLFVYQIPVRFVELLYAWPFAIVLALLGTLGPGSFLAAINVKYRDFRYAIPFIIQALFFLTPVIYPVSMLQHPWLKYMLSLNPMYAPITLLRMPLVSETTDQTVLLISISSTLFFLFFGFFYFRKTEHYFADLA